MSDEENYIAYRRLRERYLDLYLNEKNPTSKSLLHEQYKIFCTKEKQYIDEIHRTIKHTSHTPLS